MLRQLIGLPQISATASTLYETDDREFHADRFRLNEFTASQLQRVLLLDDTWTTGGRIQSLSYALKVAGARSVVAVILGRHINPDWDPSRPIIEAIRQRPFDINRCVLDS
jgi:adenine/guanine phosphoribosyltransferase-like PRPP-binding protein